MKKIRVLIVDDSRTTRMILRTIFQLDAQIEIVGEAENGQEALQKTLELKPDIITMDLHMPDVDGVMGVKMIMERCPTPILVVTGAEEAGDSTVIFQALRAGALDIVDKPKRRKGERYGDLKDELIQKVKTLATVKVDQYGKGSQKFYGPSKEYFYQAVAIGASTGGPKTLAYILRDLPKNYPLPIFLVQHITSQFTQGFAKWLNQEIPLEVVIPTHNDIPKGGKVYIAPAERHMVVEEGKIRCIQGTPRNGCIPSIDVLFESIATEYGESGIGVLLTGMGEDGARGLKKIRDAQGYTIVQDEKTCIIYGMPKVAVEKGAAIKIASPPEITRELLLAIAE